MNTIKQRLLTNWHLMRIFRLTMGIWLLVMGIQARDWMVGAFSVFFLYQAITNTGCCGDQGCYAPRKKAGKQLSEAEIPVEYEEVK